MKNIRIYRIILFVFFAAACGFYGRLVEAYNSAGTNGLGTIIASIIIAYTATYFIKK